MGKTHDLDLIREQIHKYKATLHSVESGRIFYQLRVYGDREHPTAEPLSPYDQITDYIFQVEQPHNQRKIEALEVLLDFAKAIKGEKLRIIYTGGRL